MSFDNTQAKIISDVSKKLDINHREAEKALDLYYKGIANIIKVDKPSCIIMPFFGKLYMNSKEVKKYNEANNIK